MYLFVVPWPVVEEGGLNQVVLNLVRQFRTSGAYTPWIWVTSWEHRRPSTMTREDGTFVTYMRIRSPIVPGVRAARAAARIAKWFAVLVPELLRIAHFLRVNHVAYVNLHYPSLAALQVVLTRSLCARRVKIILSFHGLDLARAGRTRGLERWMWRVLLRQSDAVVTCSNAETELVLRFAPAVRARAATIHNGIDIEEAMRARNRAAQIDPRLRERRFILSVASYEPKKGLDTLLRAFRIVRDEHRIDAKLALVGPDLGIGEQLRELAARLGVSGQVVFCGELPHRDLHAYYASASVFCLCSRAEPFGIVLLEAGAFRCPVVATSVGGIPEILKHDVNACLVPPDDPVALGAELRRLLCDRETSERLSEALYRHIDDNFTWSRAHGGYMSLVDRLDTAGRRPASVSCGSRKNGDAS
ncbi:MAG TPA: glycosyltransferase family 4 protein [Casimicrobiaceae bacterium]